MKRPVLSEASMASLVVEHLKGQGFQVFQEVTNYGSVGGRADIVATKGYAVSIVEAKLRLSFDLLAQAEKWKAYANTVHIAVPAPKRSEHTEGRLLALRVCDKLGLGVYQVTSLWPTDRGPAVEELLHPERRASFAPGVRDALRQGHQTHAQAGTNRGGQFTRFKQTCDALAAFAASRPGEPLRAVLSVIDHHYTSIAIGVERLSKYHAEGKVSGVDLRTDDTGVVRVYPTHAKETAA